MNSQRIEHLIKKYEKGETSVREEQELKAFFQQDEIPFNLRGYRDIFTYFDVASREELLNPDFDEKVIAAISETRTKRSFVKIRSLYGISGIAASIVVLIGFYFVMRINNTYQDTYSDPELAYAEVKRVLMKVSGNFNEGTKELKNVKEMENGLDELNKIAAFDDGVKSMNKISVLDKSNELITTKNNE